MASQKPSWDPAAEGVASEVLAIWRILLPAAIELSRVVGGPDNPRIGVKIVRIWRMEFTPVGEQTVAPVQLDDLRPGTSLVMNLVLLLDEREITTDTVVYIDESGGPKVVVTDIPEFDIVRADVEDNKIRAEMTDRIRDLLTEFPALTVTFLELLLQGKRRKNEKGKGGSA